MSDPARGDAGAPPWWRAGVLYQIYPRSFADSTGDGHGDLGGVIDHLDHLAWLGVDGIWLNPINPSPDADWGYDVVDYRSVDPDFGTDDDLDRLVTEAGARGMRVLLDLVPNHTSDRHPWFVDARRDRSASHRDWYVWADGRSDGSPPNNWRSAFGGPAWTWDDTSDQYYLHNFLPEQPDLNWWNDEVREEFDDVLRSWFDRGIAGFRIDVAHALVKDRQLRDDSIALETDHPQIQRHGLRSDFSMNRPEGHDVLKRWRAIANAYDPPRVLLGETWVLDLETLVAFYGSGDDELHLALNVPFVFSTPGDGMREVVERTESLLPPEAWPLWNGSNHDAGRFPSRWAEGDEGRARAAMVILLTLRGTPLLYYGDEIGMREIEVPRERLRDPVGIRHWPEDKGRDRSRTPMQWDRDGGFTRDGVEPWLPVGDAAARNVADQRDDPGSMLHLCRDLIALRHGRADLRSGASAPVEAPAGVWAWRRGDSTLVAVNHGDEAATVPVPAGEILLGTERAQDGRRVDGSIRLEPWEAIVVGEG
ncbi:MAG TPA: alpha-amylase family glycosyl hydrolase [Actinomycetota bacterium]|nr:alpha-amylase family glycosyl hydrolase [Actinomycetota bacterium]